MRVCKFRAWDSKNKVMLEHEDILDRATTLEHLDEFIPAYEKITWYYKTERIYMQWTGLVDRNGTGIYEGDIVTYRNPLSKNTVTGYVIFLQQEAGCVIALENSDIRLGHRSMGGGYEANMNLEVVGNVYEDSDYFAR